MNGERARTPVLNLLRSSRGESQVTAVDRPEAVHEARQPKHAVAAASIRACSESVVSSCAMYAGH